MIRRHAQAARALWPPDQGIESVVKLFRGTLEERIRPQSSGSVKQTLAVVS